jgi:hypothetical protein
VYDIQITSNKHMSNDAKWGKLQSQGTQLKKLKSDSKPGALQIAQLPSELKLTKVLNIADQPEQLVRHEK